MTALSTLCRDSYLLEILGTLQLVTVVAIGAPACFLLLAMLCRSMIQNTFVTASRVRFDAKQDDDNPARDTELTGVVMDFSIPVEVEHLG